ncbi:MAG: maleylpyruvate isomerase N-terminal domain-containing protein, partial [Pseudomonadales bacterium]|nr:maleylpyruvate isomerase N-terminal domain-containing protein [Pseudomonadales bacterium]
MMQQAQDLLEEGKELKSLLDTLSGDQLNNATNFKNWTVNKVVQHLHGSDRMAVLSLKDPEGFKQAIKQPERVRSNMNPEQTGTGLVQDWWQYFEEMADLLGDSDPKRRLPWFGP